MTQPMERRDLLGEGGRRVSLGRERVSPVGLIGSQLSSSSLTAALGKLNSLGNADARTLVQMRTKAIAAAADEGSACKQRIPSATMVFEEAPANGRKRDGGAGRDDRTSQAIAVDPSGNILQQALDRLLQQQGAEASP